MKRTDQAGVLRSDVSGCCKWLLWGPERQQEGQGKEASAEVQVGEVMVGQEGTVGNGWVVDTLRRQKCWNLLMYSMRGPR